MSAGAGERVLAILGYHSIGPPSPGGWQTWYYIPEEVFVVQLRYLSDHGWQVIDPATLLRGLDEPERLPLRAALLTFDDGYRSMRTVTLPILRDFDCPAVLFVPTDYIGGRNSFEPPGWAPEEPICDWDDLRELQRQRVSIQSHGASHRHLSELDPSDCEREVIHSKTVLQDGLGTTVDLFSYPYGDDGASPLATESALRRAGYRAACLYDEKINQLTISSLPNPYRLSRLKMGPDADMAQKLPG